MKKEIKARWVTALRGEEYQQGAGYLRTIAGKFCCLGVLCELAVADQVIQPAVPGKGLYERYLTSLDNRYVDERDPSHAAPEGFGYMYANLPHEVAVWAGLPDEGHGTSWPAEHEFFGKDVGFAELNDEKHWTFGQIADAIEKYVPDDDDDVVADPDSATSSEGEGTAA